MINDIIYIKILKALELICPLYQNNLITEAIIVGSVAKGTATEDSDIDVILINPNFIYQYELSPNSENEILNKISKLLINLNVDFHYIGLEHKISEEMWYQSYKNELFHIRPDSESESIKKAGEYIEIKKQFCDIIKIK